MRFTPTAVDGAFVIDVDPVADERGFFARTWCRDEFATRGLVTSFPQENVTFNHRRGTLRGLHLQLVPHAEAKVVRCTRGRAWDVAVDLRPGSPTRRRIAGVELSADNHRMLYVPEGCAHGYLTRVDDTEVSYLTSAIYAPDAATGVRHDDPALDVPWPEPVLVVSAADRSWPLLESGHLGGPR
jgi:dTDP-4-dehydrorhamnose 3,5-epimerase